ncbi:Arc family DNA-binding protein [Aeromonas veronii]|uniref:Arc family DNA-binding protein n=1 Tax=Aeromonas veronii TaxID=654 RepID=UPI0011199578|nr:Arc family DNA-binding protein [Aeromonas veronii]TNI33546.1 hypothetical protein CF128_19320 [Aeromonas veronii]
MQQDQIKSTSLRLPNEIRKWLGHRAVENGRSINSEIVMIFKEKIKEEEDRNTVTIRDGNRGNLNEMHSSASKQQE